MTDHVGEQLPCRLTQRRGGAEKHGQDARATKCSAGFAALREECSSGEIQVLSGSGEPHAGATAAAVTTRPRLFSNTQKHGQDARATGLALCLCVSVVILLSGCKSATELPKSNSLPPLNTDLARVDENLAGAKHNIEAAMPHADAVGQGLLGSAINQLVSGANRVASAFTLSARAQQERDQAITAAQAWEGKYQAVYDSLPQRIWRWAVRLFWLWLILHVGLGVVALFVPGPVGAVLAGISHFVNPLGWFTAARENVWFRVMKKKEAT